MPRIARALSAAAGAAVLLAVLLSGPAASAAPMPVEPFFDATSADHAVDAERSVIGVELAPGSANLNPAGELTVRDYTGTAVSRTTVRTDSVYDHDATRVQAMLDGALEPGAYTVDITFTDAATGATATGKALPFTVLIAERHQALRTSGPGLLPYAVGGSVSLAVLAVVLYLRELARRIGRTLRRRRRHRRRREGPMLAAAHRR